jgi:hypothetical protein
MVPRHGRKANEAAHVRASPHYKHRFNRESEHLALPITNVPFF